MHRIPMAAAAVLLCVRPVTATVLTSTGRWNAPGGKRPPSWQPGCVPTKPVDGSRGRRRCCARTRCST